MGFQSITPEQRAAYVAKAKATRRENRSGNRAKLRKDQVIALRDQGVEIGEIAKKLHMKPIEVRKIVYNGVITAERVQRFNEALISRNAAGIKVVDYWLEKNDKNVAMWLLKETGVVGKEQVSLTINANTTNVTLNQDVIEAARQVAALMKAAPQPALPLANVIDAEVISPEENSSEHIEGAVGDIPHRDGSSGGAT